MSVYLESEVMHLHFESLITYVVTKTTLADMLVVSGNRNLILSLAINADSRPRLI